MQEALRQSEERYRLLFESIDEGFCVVEVRFDDSGTAVDYRFLEVNPAFESQTGMTDAAGRWMRDLEPHHEEHWFEIYGRVARTGQPERFVQEARHLDGRWFDVYAFRVGLPDEWKVGILFRDITQRRHIEEQLREADRAKDEFLAVLAHELRNPLAPLSNGIELLSQARRQPELLDDLRPMMKRQLNHLVRLVDDLLDVSRVSRGKVSLSRTSLDLNAPVRAAIEQLTSVVREGGHHLHLELAATPLMVHGDFERLTQVVANLLSNASKYMDAGGSITVRTLARDGEAVVHVTDVGYGIPPDYMPRLFQLFSQVPEHQAKFARGGLGIGLALSRELVEMHGGSIGVRSEGIDRGSEFSVRLPLSAASSRAGVSPQAEASEGPARRVLVVDDNPDAAEGLRLLLTAKGHTVEAVHDGPGALTAIERSQPDVVLLDLGLPGMDGVEVARRIRAMTGGDGPVLIAVTGWGQEQDKARTREAGFQGHLTKPVDFRQITRLLATLPAPG